MSLFGKRSLSQYVLVALLFFLAVIMSALNQGQFSFTIILFVIIGHIFSYSSLNILLYIRVKQCMQSLYQGIT